jgi:hypothetical protein
MRRWVSTVVRDGDLAVGQRFVQGDSTDAALTFAVFSTQTPAGAGDVIDELVQATPGDAGVNGDGIPSPAQSENPPGPGGTSSRQNPCTRSNRRVGGGTP